MNFEAKPLDSARGDIPVRLSPSSSSHGERSRTILLAQNRLSRSLIISFPLSILAVLNMRKISLFLIGICGLPAALFSQGVKDTSIFSPLVLSSYAFQLPGGDLADRFGHNSNVALALQFKTTKYWIFGIEGAFLFGNKLKETGILDSISTSSGFIIDGNGLFAEVHLWERGFSTQLQAGRMFPFKKPNPNCGIVALLGTGLLQHKIRIENVNNTAPQISKEYRKGYDRLTNGLCVTEFIGYYFLGNKKLINFFGGIECTQAFTKSRRSWDYDLMRQDTESRIDLLFGLRAGWILPLYKKAAQPFYYY